MTTSLRCWVTTSFLAFLELNLTTSIDTLASKCGKSSSRQGEMRRDVSRCWAAEVRTEQGENSAPTTVKEGARWQLVEWKGLWVSWSVWFSLSRSCICRSGCRQLDAELSHRGKRPMKGCPAGSRHRPEGHRSHSGGWGERSIKYSDPRAVTWGSGIVIGKEGV